MRTEKQIGREAGRLGSQDAGKLPIADGWIILIDPNDLNDLTVPNKYEAISRQLT